MKFTQALAVQPGVTAVIGSGGKTALLLTLAEELRSQGTVLLCTTTKIYPPAQCPTLLSPTEETVAQALSAYGVVCVGTQEGTGKLSASQLTMEQLGRLSDYVLVEADGSKRLPLKAHAAYEPVIPPEAGQTICVVGLSGLGQTIQQAAHRAERYARLAGAEQTDVVTPERAARVLNAEGLGDRFFLNQADDDAAQQGGLSLRALLAAPAVIGSLKERFVLC